MENAFSFHLKRSFSSQDIHIFVSPSCLLFFHVNHCFSTVCTPPPPFSDGGGGWASAPILKKGRGAHRIYIFRGGLLEKMGVTFLHLKGGMGLRMTNFNIMGVH